MEPCTRNLAAVPIHSILLLQEMQTFDWSELRPHNGTQHAAFEELCCQLASREAVPAGSVFHRLGTPDGGVEGYHQFPNGDEWGFQAKFIQILGDSQLGQMDRSVKRALQTHPKLTRLTICVPINLADPRGLDISATDRWNKRVVKWKRWAADLGRDVIFDKWGDHEIGYRLTNAEHRGRLYFWFNKELLSKDWFEQRAKEAIADAGPRYTPELHIGLPISDFFEALGRTQRFSSVFRKLQGSVLRAAQQLRKAAVPETANVAKAELLSTTQAFVEQLVATEFEQPVAIAKDHLTRMAETLLEQCWQLRRSLEVNKQPLPEGYTKNPFATAQHDLHNLSRAINQLQIRLDGSELAVANARCLLVTGQAGTGKTHLLADVNMRRIGRGLPSVLFLGEKFTDRPPLTQIVELLRFSGTPEELLGALNAAAEAAGGHTTILIDALNEGAGRELWRKHLAGLLTAVHAYPRLCVALSVRSTYESVVVPPQVKDKAITVAHSGFGEHIFEAITRFFSNYSIKLAGAPLATSEFSNPLFLKLFCEGLKRNRISEVPVGHEGVTRIFSFLLDAVETSLKQGPAHKERPSTHLIRPFLEKLAAAMAETTETWIDVPRAETLSAACAPSMEGSDALLYQLIREGILAKEMIYTKNTDPVEVIRFAYERVGDHALAHSILADKNALQVREMFASNGKIGERLRGPMRYSLQGFLEAAMIQVSEKLPFELFSSLDWIKGYDQTIIEEAFLHSCVWRRSEAFTEETWKHLTTLEWTTNEQLLNVLLVIATRRGHAYNAEYLHRCLLSLPLAERDRIWTIVLNRSYESGTTTELLTYWSRSYLDSQLLDDESARLLALTLTWFCTSTNRVLRDRATKSLVCVLVARPEIALNLLLDFRTCNDPFVLERLYAAIYGAAMLLEDCNLLKTWASYIRAEITKKTFPVSILTRDYARGIVERARTIAVAMSEEDLAAVRPPYGSRWPKHIPSAESYVYKAQFRSEMSDADRVEAGIYDQGSDDIMEKYYGAHVLRVDMFSNVRLSKPIPMHPVSRLQAFEDRLTDGVKDAYTSAKLALEQVQYLKLPSILKTPPTGEQTAQEVRVEGLIKELTNQVCSLLPSDERREARNFVIPYLLGKVDWTNGEKMEKERLRAWVTSRTLHFGWTKEKFGDHDGHYLRMLNYRHNERSIGLIAHKYRWIAYTEFLALTADNYHFLNPWSHSACSYTGPWQIGTRDVDPSFIHCGKPQVNEEELELDTDPFSPYDMDDDWLQNTSDLPGVKGIVLTGNADWVTLDCSPEWSDPLRPEEELGSRSDYRVLRYWIHGYFVRTEHVDSVCSFLDTARFSTLRMPVGGDLRDIFFGELYWSPAWKHLLDPDSGWGYEDWSKSSKPALPHPVLATRWSYFTPEGDNSFDGSTSVAVPAPWFAAEANLRWSGRQGEWLDAKGILVVKDPTLVGGGRPRLEVRRSFLESFLIERGLDLIWTFQGEKTIMDNAQYPYTEFDGCYRYVVGGDIKGNYRITKPSA